MLGSSWNIAPPALDISPEKYSGAFRMKKMIRDSENIYYRIKVCSFLCEEVRALGY